MSKIQYELKPKHSTQTILPRWYLPSSTLTIEKFSKIKKILMWNLSEIYFLHAVLLLHMPSLAYKIFLDRT